VDSTNFEKISLAYLANDAWNILSKSYWSSNQ